MASAFQKQFALSMKVDRTVTTCNGNSQILHASLIFILKPGTDIAVYVENHVHVNLQTVTSAEKPFKNSIFITFGKQFSTAGLLLF